MSYFCAVSQRVDRLVGRVGKREHDPAWIGARRLGRNRHAAHDAVGTGRGFDAQLVAPALVDTRQASVISIFSSPGPITIGSTASACEPRPASDRNKAATNAKIAQRSLARRSLRAARRSLSSGYFLSRSEADGNAIFIENRKKPMVLPCAINFQIPPG